MTLLYLLSIVLTATPPGGVGLPGGIAIDESTSAWLQVVLIIVATFILEDPTCVAVGLLVRSGLVEPVLGIVAAMVGIFLGDLGLYVLGHFGGSALRSRRWFRRRFSTSRLDRMQGWFNAHGWTAIVATRFMPGTRIPLYVAIGVSRGSVLRFIAWTAVAIVIWVPLLVLGTAFFGGTILGPIESVIGEGVLAWIIVGVVMLVLLHVVSLSLSRDGRLRLRTFFARCTRWEFWPPIAFYAPILPWCVYRYLRMGRMRTATAVDPCWPDGGAIGESKQHVLDLFPSSLIEPSFRRETELEADEVLRRIEEEQWHWPVILKPDEGQRGEGVKLVENADRMRTLLEDAAIPLIVQRYHPGPLEAGLFWWRRPEAEKGMLFSICDKVFPRVTGDGRSTLRDLIVANRRLRLQHRVFFRRFDERLEEVLEEGEELQLTHAGNHAQGCMFRDGEHLRTRELERWIDEACSEVPGYYYGRIDVRYADVEEFKRGVGISIIEANGLSSESTNMYDPSFPITRAWGIMRKHWVVAMEIGNENRSRGVHGINEWTYLRNWIHWRRTGRSTELAD
jgi:membrane protein DedA with SNARE-associated domain